MRTRRLMAVMAACVCAALAPVRVRGEDKPVTAVPPELVAKLTGFLKKFTEAQRKSLDARMAAEIADVAKVTGLAPDGVKSLEAAAPKAEDAAQADMTAKCLETLPKEYAKNGTQDFEGLDESEAMDWAVNINAVPFMGVDYTEARQQPVWKEALAHMLTPEQAAVWEKTQAERKEAATKLIGNFLDPQLGQYQKMYEESMHTRSNDIVSWLDLPKERADGIAALVKKAVDTSVDAWRTAATKALLQDDEATLKGIVKNRGFYFPFNPSDAPEEQAVWKDGLAKLLSDDDRARLQAARDAHRARRVHALAQLMVETLDEKIALTTNQRPRLEPITERLVQGDKAMFPGEGESSYAPFGLQNFFKAAAAAKPEEVRPVLDDLQWTHWQQVSHDKNLTSNPNVEVPPAATPTPVSNDAPPVGEPENLEQTVSDFLRTRTATLHKEAEAVSILQAEDATRVAGLPEPVAARLQTAARGAAEAAVEANTSSLEENVRSQLQGATPENIQQRLTSVDRYYYERPDPKTQSVWNTAVDTELTAPQRAAWEAERSARERYNSTAIAGYMLAEFDRKVSLTTEQWNKLVPIVAQAVEDYRPDIGQMFAYNNSTPWFLTSYYMFLPLHAIPENDLKATLNPGQWDLWTGSSEYTYSTNYWANISANHNRRTSNKSKP